jgi:hypothetical protein
MMGQQARASVRVMRLWKPHDPGRSCLHCTIQHYVTNETDSQNYGALVSALGLTEGAKLVRDWKPIRISSIGRAEIRS